MRKERKLWNFIAERLHHGERVMLLVVVESTGSSPGRTGYKMAVALDGLCGSIGGGVMEVALVEEARSVLSDASSLEPMSPVREQIHRKNVSNASGMICSGGQTVVLKHLTPDALPAVRSVADALGSEQCAHLSITANSFAIKQSVPDGRNSFERLGDADFTYIERLGPETDLYIIGGGHCALALSELVSWLDFRISIFDDRPGLHTLKKNEFADEITIIDGYDKIAKFIPDRRDVFIVIMTLGYASDAVVIRQLAGRDVKYLGVLGSKAKMATLLKELKAEGIPAEQLARIHTPIGIAINSHTPEEIAVSIAAELISVKNA